MLIILKPLYLILFYSACFLLFSLGLSSEYEMVNLNAVIYFTLCTTLLFLGYQISHFSFKSFHFKSFNVELSFIYVLYSISSLLLIFEHIYFFLRFGTVPILNPDFELLRMEFMVNGYVHVIAMSSYLLCSIIYFYETHKAKRISCIIITMTLFLLMGNRAEIVAFSFLLFCIYRKDNFSAKAFILFCGVLLILFGITRLLRDYFFFGESVFSSIDDVWVLDDSYLSAVLYYIYVGLTFNFKAFNLYVMEVSDYFYGYFTILYPWLTIISSDVYTLKDLQADVLGIHFHGTITPTMFTIPYVDFSYFGSLIFLMIGYVWGLLYTQATKGVTGFYIMYAYFSWNMVMGMYEFMFYKFYVIFNLVLIVICCRFLVRFKFS
ncbi:oligosaccharide repeat unit polymerase [Photobacterium sp. TY1-4]|nr:oligosaccharide repeat unit polymerase [Photobacterium sp. TY1-4]